MYPLLGGFKYTHIQGLKDTNIHIQGLEDTRLWGFKHISKAYVVQTHILNAWGIHIIKTHISNA